MFLSFIVPVYNAETYLPACLRSLLAQDIPREDYEILCVNDGSRDNSLSVLREFAAANLNVVIIDQENSGVSTARNTGFRAAKGEYVWFVDADDFIKANCLGLLRDKALKTGCDRLIVGAYKFLNDLSEEEQALSQQGRLPVNGPWYDAVVWRSLLRRDFLLKHDLFFRYPALTHGEDGLFMYETAQALPKSVEIGEALYFYREHSGSAETAVSPENQVKKLRSYVQITEIMNGYYQSGRTDEATANKLMSFLWFSLYEIAKLPAKEARAWLAQLRQAGLFPYRRPLACSLTCSYMTSRKDWIGTVLDKICQKLHTRWGFFLMHLLQQAMRIF